MSACFYLEYRPVVRLRREVDGNDECRYVMTEARPLKRRLASVGAGGSGRGGIASSACGGSGSAGCGRPKSLSLHAFAARAAAERAGPPKGWAPLRISPRGGGPMSPATSARSQRERRRPGPDVALRRGLRKRLASATLTRSLEDNPKRYRRNARSSARNSSTLAGKVTDGDSTGEEAEAGDDDASAGPPAARPKRRPGRRPKHQPPSRSVTVDLDDEEDAEAAVSTAARRRDFDAAAVSPDASPVWVGLDVRHASSALDLEVDAIGFDGDAFGFRNEGADIRPTPVPSPTAPRSAASDEDGAGFASAASAYDSDDGSCDSNDWELGNLAADDAAPCAAFPETPACGGAQFEETPRAETARDDDWIENLESIVDAPDAPPIGLELT